MIFDITETLVKGQIMLHDAITTAHCSEMSRGARQKFMEKHIEIAEELNQWLLEQEDAKARQQMADIKELARYRVKYPNG